MLNIGADRANHTVNCKYAYHEDVLDVRAEQNGAQTTKSKKYYDHLLRQGDKVLKRGEVSYTCTDPESIDFDQQPYVRTCLNGKRFRSSGTAPEKLRADLEKSIRMIGFVKTDIVYNEGGNHLSFPANMQPVTIVSGKTTAYNTGNRRIDAGKGVKAYIVDPRDPNQYNDANRMSSNRKVIGVETLSLHRDMRSEVNSVALENFVKMCRLLTGKNELEAKTQVEDGLKQKSADLFLAAHRAMLMYRARNVVGVAVTHASPGGRMDVMLTTMLNPVTYSKISEPRKI